MSLAQSIVDLNLRMNDCDELVAAAHKLDSSGNYLFSAIQREKITVASFLNTFIAWEGFLEDAITKYMSGQPTMSGSNPVRFVVPTSQNDAKILIVGINKYFDYANHDNVKKISKLYFQDGYPIEPHISSINSELADLRTMRNASAHISSTTQKALEGFAQRVFSTPQPGISLYSLLTSTLPGASPSSTIFEEYQQKLLTAAGLIAHG